MKKAFKVGRLINKLRSSRGESQKEFAGVIGATRTAVAAWESGVYQPGIDDCLKISQLIEGANGKLKFLDAAGANISAMADLIVQLRRESLLLPKEGEMIAVPPLNSGNPDKESSEKESSALLLPPQIAPDVASVRYFRVPEGSGGGGMEYGDIFLLDVSETGTRSLMPFWDQRILLEIRQPRTSYYVPMVTHEVGRIRILPGYRGERVLSYEAWCFPWIDKVRAPGEGHDEIAALQGQEYQPRRGFEYLQPIRIGTCEVKRPRTPEDPLDRAQRQMRVSPEFSILGRVIGWFAAQQVLLGDK